jgi:hypothetical protein
MQHIHFQARHAINDSQQQRQGHEMTRNIDHHTPPTEARPVLDQQTRAVQLTADMQLPQGGDAM